MKITEPKTPYVRYDAETDTIDGGMHSIPLFRFHPTHPTHPPAFCPLLSPYVPNRTDRSPYPFRTQKSRTSTSRRTPPTRPRVHSRLRTSATVTTSSLRPPLGAPPSPAPSPSRDAPSCRGAAARGAAAGGPGAAVGGAGARAGARASICRLTRGEIYMEWEGTAGRWRWRRWMRRVSVSFSILISGIGSSVLSDPWFLSLSFSDVLADATRSALQVAHVMFATARV